MGDIVPNLSFSEYQSLLLMMGVTAAVHCSEAMGCFPARLDHPQVKRMTDQPPGWQSGLPISRAMTPYPRLF